MIMVLGGRVDYEEILVFLRDLVLGERSDGDF